MGKKEMSFHQRAYDREPLPTWMHELMVSTDPAGEAATSSLAASRRRHACCFEELRRQTESFSPQLARLYGKVWAGSESIAGCMALELGTLRYESARFEAHKQGLLNEAEAQRVATAREVEDARRELAASRAESRESRSECEALHLRCESLRFECEQLRLCVGRFVEGKAPEDAEDVAEDVRREARRLSTAADSEGEPYSPRAIERLARARQQSVFEMDDEIDTVFASARGENAKQKRLLHEMDALLLSVRATDFSNAPAQADLRPGTDAATQVEALTKQAKAVDMLQPPPRVAPRSPVGLNVPLLLRQQMTNFPVTTRIPSAQATLKLILNVYLDKLLYDRNCDERRVPRTTLGAFPYQFLLKKFGLVSLADEQTVQLVTAIEHHQNDHKRIRLFGDWIGMRDKTSPPSFRTRDCNFVFSLLQALRKAREFTEKLLQDKDQQIDVNRKKAVESVKLVFADVLPDGGVGVSQRVQNLPAPNATRNALCVDLDDLLELTNVTWSQVNTLWQGHLRYLFSRHAQLFSVKQEMRFADDNGNASHDATLVEEKAARNSTLRPPRRPAQVQTAETDAAARGREEEGVGAARRDFCALMNFAAFDAFIREIDPFVTVERVELLHARGCKLMQRAIAEAFLEVWHRYRYVDGEPVADQLKVDDALTQGPQTQDPFSDVQPRFWHSPQLARAQWVAPFDSTKFQVCEFDCDVFLELCLEEMLLSKSPFARILAKAPSDLWPNSEAYLAQIEENDNVFS